MSKLARGILDAKQESKRKSGSSGKGSLYDAWIELVAEVEEIGNLHVRFPLFLYYPVTLPGRNPSQTRSTSCCSSPSRPTSRTTT